MEQSNYNDLNDTNDTHSLSGTMASGSQDKKKTKMKSASYGKMVIDSLSSLKQNDELCDFKVQAKGKELKVHKVLLAATSHYFRAMLSGRLKESKADFVDLKGLSADSLQLVVDFIYSGEMELDLDNLTDVLNAASHLQIDSALDLCSDYMISLITFSSAEEFLNIADTYSLEKVKEFYKNKVLQNFEEFGETEQFLALGAGQLKAYLSDNDLRIRTEVSLFNMVGKWYMHDSNRADTVDGVLKCLRYCLMSEAQLRLLEQHWLRRHFMSCQTYIDEGLKYHLDASSGHPWLTDSTKIRSSQESLVMVHQGSHLKPFEVTAFNHKDNKFYQLKADISGSRDCRVASVDNFVYVCRVVDCGGGTLMNSLLRFDPRHLTLHELSPCRRLRIDPALVAKDKWLYITGGTNENYVILDSVECYDIRSNMWRDLLPLPSPTHSHAAAVCGEHIYVSGGVAGQDQQLTARMVTYHPTSHIWETKASMHCPRRLHEMVAVGNKLFVLGGIGAHSFHQQTQIPIEGFDPATNQWTRLSSTIAGRSVGHYIEFDSSVIAIGRELYQAEEEDIWVYETDSDTWRLQTKAPRKTLLTSALCSHLCVNFHDEHVLAGVLPDRR